MTEPTTSDQRASPSRRLLGPAIAVLLFSVATVITFDPVLRAGPADYAAVQPMDGAFFTNITRADAKLQTWLVSRNAYTLATRPHRLFDAEHCAPAERTLAFGIPMVTQGLVAIPISLFTGEPVLVYNLSIVALVLLSAFAMYALVTRWTGNAGAGLVAGLLFGFMPQRLAQVTYPSVWDISWTVLAIFFAERLFESGRWRDAVFLAAAVSLQIGASFYPLLSAAFLTPALLLWLLLRYGLQHVRASQLAFIALVTVLTAVAILGPYLGAETDTGKLERTEFLYLPWTQFARPDGPLFPGFTVLALAAVALLGGSQRAAPGIGGDPRWAVVVGGVVVGLVAAGPNTGELIGEISPALASFVPDPHAVFASFVPGLDAVRGINRLSAGLHLALILLAGLGAGILIRAAGKHAQLAAIALVAIAALDVLRLPALGLEQRYRWNLEQIHAKADDIAFFEELARRGNQGDVLELPDRGSDAAERILLSAYHRRRTSACFASFQPAGRKDLAAVIATLPRASAVTELASLGFTTVVVHHDQGPRTNPASRALERAAQWKRVERIHSTPHLSAYALRPGKPR